MKLFEGLSKSEKTLNLNLNKANTKLIKPLQMKVTQSILHQKNKTLRTWRFFSLLKVILKSRIQSFCISNLNQDAPYHHKRL